jgi:hypothetical protein
MATTNTTPKFTKAMAFAIALEALSHSNHPDAPKAMEKIQTEVENLAKKKSGGTKQTAKQTANIGLGESIVEFLREHPNQLFTIGELMKQVPNLPEDISNQKMTSLFRLDSVKPYFRREMVKGKAYFQYAEPAEVED